MQNDLKTLGNRFLGRDLNFLKNVKNGSGQKLFTLLGHFGMSGAEWPEIAREQVFGARSDLFGKMTKMGPEKIVHASGTFWDVRCRMT